MRRSTVGQQVRAALAAVPGAAAGSSGVVGFSGGPDSLCLLHALRELAAPLQLTLRAVVVDHGLRPASGEDAEAARRLSEALGVAAEVVRLGSRPARGNVQEWGRAQRLRTMAQTARACGAGWIAVGHNADDQAETVLMRAVRGAGVGGLGAMARCRALGESAAAGLAPLLLLRPLLDVTRREIEAYLRRRGLQPLEDPSNASDAYLRNRVRQRVLPALRAENPRAARALCRLADNCREADAALNELAAAALSAAERDGALAVAQLASLPTALLSRALQRAFTARAGGLRLDRAQSAALCALVRDTAGTQRLSLPGAFVAERSYGALRFAPAAGRGGCPALGETLIAGPGAVQLADGRWLALEAHEEGPGTEGQWLDLRRVRFPLRVRGPRPGDRIAIGPGQHKKIARLMIDAKLPAPQRPAVPVLLQGDELLLVVGLRSAYGATAARGYPALRVGWRR